MIPLLYIPIAFLCGSIPSGLLICKAKGIDIRKHGSGNIGATNVGRVLGRKWFFICFLCDFAKACVPTLLCGRQLEMLGRFDVLWPHSLIWLGAMVAAVLGNVFNPWLGGKGGKGVATSIGALMGVFPALAVPGIGILLVWIVALKIWRYISSASIAAAIALPVFILVQSVIVARRATGVDSTVLLNAAPFLVVGTLLAALVVFTHRANIKRLIAGTEPKVGQRVSPT